MDTSDKAYHETVRSRPMYHQTSFFFYRSRPSTLPSLSTKRNTISSRSDLFTSVSLVWKVNNNNKD